VRIGRRVYDDGCDIAERTLATIGDDCTLNAGTAIQCHSLEDGTFKSDRIVLGAGCTLGINAFVHYGATLGDGAVLEADSFLMKGEEVAPGARWRGNPAREMRGRPTAVTAATTFKLPPPSALPPFPAFDRGRDAHAEAAE
jgi:non-ribosomal peptide synthetase-like protein